MGYVKRRCEQRLRDLLKRVGASRRVILVEGVRQVGKTTMITHVLETLDRPVVTVDLEEQVLLCSRIDACREFSDFADLMRDETGFDPDDGGVLFIDEAQESSALGRFVRFMKEKWSSARVVLSGSTLGRLFRPEVRYPVGRVERLVVRPFTFSEFLAAVGQDHLAEFVREGGIPTSPERHGALLEHLDRYLEVGGLPQVVIEHAAEGDPARSRAEIVAQYERDFIRLFGEDAMAIVMGCLRSVASFVGSPSKNSSVIPGPTNRINEEIKRVFARLEGWGLILRSDQRGPSPEASHRYLPKRYLFDTGVLRGLREMALPTISVMNTLSASERKPLGGVIENQLAVELRDHDCELAGWKRAPSGQEIDFVVRLGGVPCPIECKATLRLKRTHLRGLSSYLEQFDLTRAFVVSFAPYGVVDLGGGRHVVNIPLYLAEELGSIVERAV